jgi:hypothetical protein
LVGILLWVATQLPGAEKESGAYAVVAGTVFQEPGFALRGAELTLVRKPEGTAPKKEKSHKAVSDSRGEFAFHVPPGPAEYVLTVKAQGFESAAKRVTVSALERVDEFITLKPVQKKE